MKTLRISWDCCKASFPPVARWTFGLRNEGVTIQVPKDADRTEEMRKWAKENNFNPFYLKVE